MVKNEIDFMRELKMCENVSQLEQVYISSLPETGETVLSLVMKFAKYGSIFKEFCSNRRFNEE